MERREAFKRWLQNEKIKKTGKHIPEKTIEVYLRSIHKLSDAMYEEGIISKRLYSIRDAEELAKTIAIIKRQQTYLTMNEVSENKVHKALNYYISFTQAMNAKEEEKAEI